MTQQTNKQKMTSNSNNDNLWFEYHMSKIDRIEYLKQMIDEMRQEGYNKIADLFADDLAKELDEYEGEEKKRND